MVHLHFPRYPSPTVFPPHLEIQYSCDLTAWQQHITVLYNDCVSAQSFWHLSRNPFKSSGPYLCVWPYSKLGPNPLPLLPPSIYSTLLKDQIRSPQFRSVVSHFLPSPSCRIWAFTSSSGVKKREHLLWDPWVWSCWSSTYHGQQGPAGALLCPELPCRFFSIYPSDISHVPILPIPFLVRKEKCREWRQKGGHKAGVQLKEDGIKVEGKKSRN